MYADQVISNTLKLFSISWSFGLGFLLGNYIWQDNAEISLNLWEALMILQQFFSWVIIILYLLTWTFATPSNSTLVIFKGTFLTLSGPYLLVLSIGALIADLSMRVHYFILTFLAWWLQLAVSVYCTFKLFLEVSIYIQRQYKRAKLKEHYKSINMRSISSNSK